MTLVILSELYPSQEALTRRVPVADATQETLVGLDGPPVKLH